MSEKIDRRIGSSGLLLVTVVIILILAGAAGSYAWLRMTRTPAFSGPVQEQPPLVQPSGLDEPLMFTLFVPDDGILSAITATAKRQPDTHSQARETLFSAFAGALAERSPVLKQLAPRAFFLDEAGIAYIDLMPLSPAGTRASARDELLGLYAIVNTLTSNFEEIKGVRFLLDGRETQTLAGHIDLSKKFTKRMDLVKQ